MYKNDVKNVNKNMNKPKDRDDSIPCGNLQHGDTSMQCSNLQHSDTAHYNVMRTEQTDIEQRTVMTNEAYSAVGQLLLNGGSIQELLELGAQMLGNPLLLCDISTRGFGYSSKEALSQLHDELIDSILEHGFVTAALFKKYNYDQLLPEIGKLEHAQLMPSTYPNKCNRITGKVMFRNHYWGWLICLEADRTLKKEDTALVDILSQCVSFLLERRNKVITNENNEIILSELLTSTFASRFEFEARVSGFHFDAEGPWHIISIKNKDNQPTTALHAYRNHLSLILPATSMLLHHSHLVLLTHDDDLGFVLNTLNTFLIPNDLIAAVSLAFEDILDVPSQVKQTHELLEASFLLDIKDHIIHFEQYAFYHAAYQLIKSGSADSYIPEGLCKVQDYDYEYHTEYCVSIRAWLYHRSLVHAAEALNIHRNTMVYRYEKFQEISGLDLSSGDDIYRLHLAFLILDLLGEEA